VEFGLIRTGEGLRIYGSGIVSSRAESIYCLESETPKRIAFDLMRVMRTQYRIDDLQESYFVIDSFDQLFAATRPDFTPYYQELKRRPDITPGAVLPSDRLVSAGGVHGDDRPRRRGARGRTDEALDRIATD
jgi:phenylalanine-4-hydroxylase